jgi:hypothetical protein
LVLYTLKVGVGSILCHFAFCRLGGLSLFQALLGFVALNPTYILPVLLRNSKPNNGRFRNRAPKVSFPIRLDACSQAALV